MKIRFDLAIAALSVIALATVPSIRAGAEPAAPVAAPDAPPTVDPGVKAAIAQWAQTVGKQKAFTWKSTLKVTRIEGDPKTAKPEAREYKVTGTAEKPDRVHVEVSEGKNLVWVFSTASDKGYSYEPSKKKYTDLAHFQAHDMAGPALVTSSMFVNSDPVAFLDTGMGVPLKLSVVTDGKSSTIVGSGLAVTTSTGEAGAPAMSIKASVRMAFDTASHMLLSRSSTVEVGSVPKLDSPAEDAKPVSNVSVQETFENIEFPTSLPTDTFTWQPPADATVDTSAPAVQPDAAATP